MALETKRLIQESVVFLVIEGFQKLFPIIFLPIIVSLVPKIDRFGESELLFLFLDFIYQLFLFGLGDCCVSLYKNESEKYNGFVIIYGLLAYFVLTILLSIILFNVYPFYYILIFSTLFYLKLTAGLYVPILKSKNQNITLLIFGILNPLSYYAVFFILFVFNQTSNIYIFSILASILFPSILIYLLVIFSKKTFDFKYIYISLKVSVKFFYSNISIWLLRYLDKFMINAIFGSNNLGIYILAQKYTSATMILYNAFSSGFVNYFYKYTNEKKDLTIDFYVKIFMIIVLVLSNIFSEYIFSILYSNINQLSKIFLNLILFPLFLFRLKMHSFTNSRKINLYILLLLIIGAMFSYLMADYFGLLVVPYIFYIILEIYFMIETLKTKSFIHILVEILLALTTIFIYSSNYVNIKPIQ